MFGLSKVDKLLALNQWAKYYFGDLASLTGSNLEGFLATKSDFSQARRDATRTRLLTDVSQWNEWAEEMLAIKRRGSREASFCSIWDVLAETDLSDECFSTRVDAAAAIFPGAVNFSRASFLSDAWFNHAQFKGPTAFENTSIMFEGNFEGARFEDDTNFINFRVQRNAEFRKVKFENSVSFEGANFVKDAWFIGSRFCGPTSFRRARFGGEAGLGDCNYLSNTEFSHVFFVDTAGFGGACFAADVKFDDAQFRRIAWFSKAIFHGTATFKNTRFLGTMHFNEIKVDRTDAARQIQELMRSAGISEGM